PTATARTTNETTMAMSDLERVVVGSEAPSCRDGGGGLDGRVGAADGAALTVLAASRLRSSEWLLRSAPAPSRGGFIPSSKSGGERSGHGEPSVSPCQSHLRHVRSVIASSRVGGRRGGWLGRGYARRGGGCRSAGRGRRSARGAA